MEGFWEDHKIQSNIWGNESGSLDSEVTFPAGLICDKHYRHW